MQNNMAFADPPCFNNHPPSMLMAAPVMYRFWFTDACQVTLTSHLRLWLDLPALTTARPKIHCA
jgi:hypothetical protein